MLKELINQEGGIMGSVSLEVKCKNCGGIAEETVWHRKGEGIIFCHNCGDSVHYKGERIVERKKGKGTVHMSCKGITKVMALSGAVRYRKHLNRFLTRKARSTKITSIFVIEKVKGVWQRSYIKKPKYVFYPFNSKWDFYRSLEMKRETEL